MPDNKIRSLVERVLDDVLTRGDVAAVSDVYANDYLGRFPWLPAPVEGPNGARIFVGALHTAFPDLRFDVDEILVDGSSAAFRWRALGTHRGEFFGIPSTGRPFAITGISVAHVRDGKLAEEWSSWDMLALLRQLGLATEIPEARPTGEPRPGEGTHDLFGDVPPGG